MLLVIGLFGFTAAVGFMLGYATRAAISHHRRLKVQRGLMWRRR